MRALILILLFSIAAKAHNPLIATFTISEQNGVWTMHVSMAQAGVHEAMKKHYPDEDLDAMDETAYKELMVAYIKETCNISVGEKTIALGSGGIKLGSHQTDVRLVLEGLTGLVKEMKLDIHSFSDNEGHQNIVRVAQNGSEQKFILQQSNSYVAVLQADENGKPIEAKAMTK